MSEPGHDLLEIGRIGRAHGLRGELIVSLTTNVDDRLSPGTVVRADGDDLVVESSRPHQGRWIVAFEGVASREAAEALSNRRLLAEPVDGDEDPDALWIHELIGSTVVGVDGRAHGVVRTVIDNPASDILELESGALVPLTFVVETTPGRILIDPPVGLLDDEDAVVVLPDDVDGT